MLSRKLHRFCSAVFGVGAVTIVCSLLALSKVRQMSSIVHQYEGTVDSDLGPEGVGSLDRVRIYLEKCEGCSKDHGNENRSYVDLRVSKPSIKEKTLYVNLDRNGTSLPLQLLQNSKPSNLLHSESAHLTTTRSATSSNASAFSAMDGICSVGSRRDSIHKRCAAANFPHKPRPSELLTLIFDSKHNLAYCMLYKCSSTTVIHMLNAANGGMNKEQLETLQRRNPIANSVHTLPKTHRKGLVQRKLPAYGPKGTDTSIKFAIVRHPFDRLGSCYMDKIAKNHDRYFRSLRAIIWNAYSPMKNLTLRTPGRAGQAKQVLGREQYRDSLHVTFPMFVQFVIDYNKSQRRWRGVEPGHVQHFEVYEPRCHFCHMDYDYILRTETLSQDLLPILNKIHLAPDFVQGLNFNRFQKRTKSIVDGYVLELYRGLSGEQIGELYKIYQNDFELFGYTFDPLTKEAGCRFTDDQGNSCC